MSRLALVLLLVVATQPVHAQDAKPMRIGVLLSGSSTQWSTFDDAVGRQCRTQYGIAIPRELRVQAHHVIE